MNRPSVAEFKDSDKHPVIVVLDDVRSLSNVGSVFRTCDAFKVERLVLCGITGCPPHREIQKTALGATESVAWEHHENALEAVKAVKAQGYTVVPVEQCTGSMRPKEAVHAGEKICLVLGNEVTGVKQDIVTLADTVMEIPQEGTKHSLNVSVAAGIAIWETYARFS